MPFDGIPNTTRRAPSFRIKHRQGSHGIILVDRRGVQRHDGHGALTTVVVRFRPLTLPTHGLLYKTNHVLEYVGIHTGR